MTKISAAGLYDIPIEIYHGDLCDGPSVSGSGLVDIEQTSLLHYWHGSYHNPRRPEMDTTALKFGRAAHAWILGEPEFNKYFVLSPYDEFRTKEARAWRDAQTKTIIRATQFDMIRAMGETILRTPLVKNAFRDGKPEQSLIWKDRETGIWLKSRPDWLPNTIHWTPNFKTCVSSHPDAFTRAAYGLGYHQGAALCVEGLKTVLGWIDAGYYFVAQEKKEPYVATLIKMRDTDLEWGAHLNRSALRKLANALDKQDWPGYASGAVEISMPPWAEKLLLDRHERGEFEPKQETQAA